MSIGTKIREQITGVAKEQGKTIRPLTDDLVLLESGLDSLSFAIIVVRLEEMTGSDPFSDSDDLIYPVTLADFIALYEPRRV